MILSCWNAIINKRPKNCVCNKAVDFSHLALKFVLDCFVNNKVIDI